MNRLAAGFEDGPMLRVTVSGSFRRHMTAVYEAVNELVDCGASVLSPADPRVVDQIGEFVFVASDKVRSIRMVEDRHLECISASDFLWLVAPDGYVGQSASMELGYAIAHHVPIFSKDVLADGTLRRYVRRVTTYREAFVEALTSARQPATASSFLVDPFAAMQIARERLDSLQAHFTKSASRIGDEEGATILQQKTSLAELFVPATAPRSRKPVGV